tara:strand:- start:141 stop:494 length:354 start_codon:yes stop_codon:yes gene_type:complete
MEARGPLGKASVSTESGVPPQPETDGGQSSGGGGAQGGGGASSYSDDPETELRQIMRSSDFQKFCSLCQMQGQGDVFAICRQHVAQHMVQAHVDRDMVQRICVLTSAGHPFTAYGYI